MTCMDPRPTNSQLSHFPLKGMMWGTTKIGSPCQANRLHVTKSAVQAWAESLTYAWHMAVLDHRFPPEAENSWNCFGAMSVDNKRFDQEPELASQRIRQLEEKNKEARTSLRKRAKRPRRLTRLRGLYGFDRTFVFGRPNSRRRRPTT